jgi:hypothetical protein
MFLLRLEHKFTQAKSSSSTEAIVRSIPARILAKQNNSSAGTQMEGITISQRTLWNVRHATSLQWRKNDECSRMDLQKGNDLPSGASERDLGNPRLWLLT